MNTNSTVRPQGALVSPTLRNRIDRIIAEDNMTTPYVRPTTIAADCSPSMANRGLLPALAEGLNAIIAYLAGYHDRHERHLAIALYADDVYEVRDFETFTRLVDEDDQMLVKFLDPGDIVIKGPSTLTVAGLRKIIANHEFLDERLEEQGIKRFHTIILLTDGYATDRSPEELAELRKEIEAVNQRENWAILSVGIASPSQVSILHQHLRTLGYNGTLDDARQLLFEAPLKGEVAYEGVIISDPKERENVTFYPHVEEVIRTKFERGYKIRGGLGIPVVLTEVGDPATFARFLGTQVSLSAVTARGGGVIGANRSATQPALPPPVAAPDPSGGAVLVATGQDPNGAAAPQDPGLPTGSVL